MAGSLSVATKRWAVLAAATTLAALVFYAAVQSWRADRWMSSSRYQDWEKAARILPENADYWDRLGRYLQLDFENNDLPKAVLCFQNATRVDPWQADYWLDLATAYENSGNPGQAREAFLTAKAAYPLSSEVAWRYGNYLLRQGRTTEALAEIHRAVVGDSSLVPLAASRAWHALGDMDLVLNGVLPATRDAYLSALEAFVAENALDPALAIWKRLIRFDQPLELRLANPLVDALLRGSRPDDAVTVWRDALVASGIVPRGTESFPLITNGGFERGTTNGGFDWRTYPASGVEYDFDATVAHSGARSLRITFENSPNIAFTQIVQVVPVEPRTHYRLSAYLHTESLTSDSGIRLMVFHPGGLGTPDLYSPDVVGTQPWTLNEVEFTTGPDMRVIEIHICRFSSIKPDSKIRGLAWVDDVTLTPFHAPGPGAKP